MKKLVFFPLLLICLAGTTQKVYEIFSRGSCYLSPDGDGYGGKDVTKWDGFLFVDETPDKNTLGWIEVRKYYAGWSGESKFTLFQKRESNGVRGYVAKKGYIIYDED